MADQADQTGDAGYTFTHGSIDRIEVGAHTLVSRVSLQMSYWDAL